MRLALQDERTSSTAEDQKLEYFLGSVKIMLIVYGLSAFIAMLVAGIIKLIFAGIRGQRASAAAKLEAAVNTTAGTANSEPGKAA